MSLNGLNILAVVPARGGSKGIPRKNLREVGGLSLIARAAQTAMALDWIDAAIISTDDPEMAEEGQRYGLDVPFMRPAHLATDTALGIDVWKHAWLACEEYYGKRFDISALLEPTSPLRRPEDVERTILKVIDERHPAAATISPTPAHYSPHKTLILSKDGALDFYHRGRQEYNCRQDIPQYYHRNGICYAAVRDHIIANEKHKVIDQNTFAVIIDRHVVNIDDYFELQLSDFLLRRQFHSIPE